MRTLFAVPLLFLLACASSRAGHDRAAIAKVVLDENEVMRQAWAKRDASLMAPPGDLRADLQRRMDMTTAIDQMSVEVIRIDLNGDEATVISQQRFVRTMKPPGATTERQRISTVKHRQRVKREDGQWKIVGALEEFDASAKWADEK